MKAATASSPKSGGHTGNDGGDISVFDFNEKDPRPFRDKQSSKAMFSKAFGSKGNRNLKCATISARHGKCTRGTKATNRRKKGRKSTKKSSYQQVATNEEAISPEFLSCSDKIESDDSDSVSEGEVSWLQALKKGGVVETLRSFRGAPDKVAITEKVTEVIISGEALWLSDGIWKCSPRFTFSADAIALTVSNCHSDCVFMKWPLKEISNFGFYTDEQSGLVVLELGLTHSAAELLIKKLKQHILSDDEGFVLVTVIRDIDWVERQRQITSLSDAYKILWRPLKVERNSVPALCAEGFLRSLRKESLDRNDSERRGTANSGEEDGFSDQNEEGRHAARLHGFSDMVYEKGGRDGVTLTKTILQNGKHEAMLQGWFDIVYPKGDHDAVTVTKDDFRLLNPEEFLSDTIIDFYIKHLQSTLSEHDRNRFYFFNSFFFRKLTEGETSVLYEPEKQKNAFDRVKRWTARVNIFEKDYLFIPIMRSAHWSLIVVCHPGIVSTEVDDASTCKEPVILHFDSLEGCHTGLEEPILNYLIGAWIQKYGYTGDRNSLCCKRLSEINFMSAKVPQQTNYSDCGLFLLHYVELFIGRVHKECPTEFVKEGWFNPAEASNKRAEIQNLIIRLHALELVDRCSSLILPENVALSVKNKTVSIIDALAIHDIYSLTVRDSLYSSKASGVIHNGSVESIEGSIHSDGLHGENQLCFGILDTHDNHEHVGWKGEIKNYSCPGLLVPVPASDLQGNLCSSQLQETFSPFKVLSSPSHAATKAAKNCVGSTRKEDSLIPSDQASRNLACAEINPNSENFSLDSKECMHAYRLGNSLDDHDQNIIKVPNSSHGVLRFQGSELCDYSKEISAEGLQSESTVDDKINKSPVASKQLDLSMEYEMEDLKFSKVTREKGLHDSGSISDTDKEATHIFNIEDSKQTPCSSVLKEQNIIIRSSRASDQYSKDDLPAKRDSEEDVSLQKKGKICEASKSECNISIHSNPCPMQEEYLWYESQDRTHEISLPCIQDTLRVDNTQYISSDEEPSTQYQAGLGNDVEKMLEAVNLRKRCKRKAAEDSKALHVPGRRPVTRSATKRRGVKSETATLLQQGRKHESPIEVK